MTPALSWRPRHAPGYPPECADAGDVLTRVAEEAQGTVTIAVVTSGLRAAVENSGDHEAGLDLVRRSLAAIGRSLGEGWNPSYYGKDLVVVGAGQNAPYGHGLADPAMGGRHHDVRHGWAWERIHLVGDDDERLNALLRACYAVSMAARLRRDRPSLFPDRAGTVLAQVPGLLSPQETASLLAGVLVRPLGSRRTASQARPGEDPRLPGVPSADAWRRYADAVPGQGFYAVSDVHDIEWGTVCRLGVRLTDGNARAMLPLARAWQEEALPIGDLLDRAYHLRLQRESLLLAHLRTMSDTAMAGGRLFATLGDGLSGVVSTAALMQSAVSTANEWTAGQMNSGAGVASLGDADPGTVRRRAHFGLHVTKTLKNTLHRQREIQVFGEPLDAHAADSAIGFLTNLLEQGPRAAGFHHLRHAARWPHYWRAHVPSRVRHRLDRVLESARAP